MSRHAGTAHKALGEALIALIGGAMARSRETCWASSGVSGCRHRFLLRLAEPQTASPLDRLGQARFDLPGHVVVDIAAVARAHDGQGSRVMIEALTVEDS